MSTTPAPDTPDACYTTPRNALFCCHTPAGGYTTPQLLPVDLMEGYRTEVVPVNIIDLSKLDSDAIYTTVVDSSCQNSSSSGSPRRNESEASSIASQQPPTGSNQQSTQPEPEQEQQPAQKQPPIPPTEHHTKLGVVLRRVSPSKTTLNNLVKKVDTPAQNVVLKKVERKTNALPVDRSNKPPELPVLKMLAIQKFTGYKRPPPPKKIPQLANKLPVQQVMPVKTAAPVKPPPNLAPPPKVVPVAVAPKPAVPPIRRPPITIQRIEGDRIIIIKRIPRQHGKVLRLMFKPVGFRCFYCVC